MELNQVEPGSLMLEIMADALLLYFREILVLGNILP